VDAKFEMVLIGLAPRVGKEELWPTPATGVPQAGQKADSAGSSFPHL